MATDRDKVLDLIQEQRSTRDPFQKLAQRKEQMQSTTDEILSERGNLEGMQPKAHAGGSSELLSESPETLKGVLDSSNARNELSQSGLKEAFGKYGLGELSDQLALNEYGKLQLLLRLRDKFGEQFMENNEARKVLQAFDLALKDNKKEAKENYSKMLSGANRTLGILLGGG